MGVILARSFIFAKLQNLELARGAPMKHVTGHSAVIPPNPAWCGLICCGPQPPMQSVIKAVSAPPENCPARPPYTVFRKACGSLGPSSPDSPPFCTLFAVAGWKQSPVSETLMLNVEWIIGAQGEREAVRDGFLEGRDGSWALCIGWREQRPGLSLEHLPSGGEWWERGTEEAEVGWWRASHAKRRGLPWVL